jgi:hypothetical protein
VSTPNPHPEYHRMSISGDHIVDVMRRKSDLIKPLGESCDSLESGLNRTHNQMATEQ